MKPMTRQERRAERQRQYLVKRTTPWASPDHQASGENPPLGKVDYEAPLPGWLKPLDYKVSGETGALKVKSKMRTWHLGGRANGHRPPPGQGWNRSGPARVVRARGLGTPAKPMTHGEWRRLIAEAALPSTDR